MIRRRLLLIAMVLVALLGIAVGVAVSYLYPALPDPAVADREGLFRWLVVRDLSRESEETRRTLARRLDAECRAGIDWASTAETLDAAQRQQVWANILLLLQPWLMDKLEQFHQLPPEERMAFVDELLATMAGLQGLNRLRPEVHDNDQSAAQDSLLMVLIKHIARCRQEATPEQRSQIDQFVGTIQARWLARCLQQPLSTLRDLQQQR